MRERSGLREAPDTMTTPVPRVVLDTNACLDLWVFADPRAARLLAALHAGAVEAVTNTACRDEWLRVLQYPRLQLGDVARLAHRRTHDALVRHLDDDAPSLHPDVTLPRCADPDDQKFLQLALSSGARWLVSRDGDVLALGRRTRRDQLFDIVAPQAWSLAPGWDRGEWAATPVALRGTVRPPCG